VKAWNPFFELDELHVRIRHIEFHKEKNRNGERGKREEDAEHFDEGFCIVAHQSDDESAEERDEKDY
jgi:hypothetical protein